MIIGCIVIIEEVANSENENIKEGYKAAITRLIYR